MLESLWIHWVFFIRLLKDLCSALSQARSRQAFPALWKGTGLSLVKIALWNASVNSRIHNLERCPLAHAEQQWCLCNRCLWLQRSSLCIRSRVCKRQCRFGVCLWISFCCRRILCFRLYHCWTALAPRMKSTALLRSFRLLSIQGGVLRLRIEDVLWNDNCMTCLVELGRNGDFE